VGLFDVVNQCRSGGVSLVIATELLAERPESRLSFQGGARTCEGTNSGGFTLFSNCYRVLFSGVKRPECEGNHWPLSSVEGKISGTMSTPWNQYATSKFTCIHSMTLHPIPLSYILISSCHLCLGRTSGSFLQISPPEPFKNLSFRPHVPHASSISNLSSTVLN
jgi:hypothetical protein